MTQSCSADVDYVDTHQDTDDMPVSVCLAMPICLSDMLRLLAVKMAMTDCTYTLWEKSVKLLPSFKRHLSALVVAVQDLVIPSRCAQLDKIQVCHELGQTHCWQHQLLQLKARH